MKALFLRKRYFECIGIVLLVSIQCCYSAEAGSDPDSGIEGIIELSCSEPLGITHIYPNQVEVYKYHKFELTFDVSGHWNNPFDPEQVKVDGLFTAPDGKELVVPGFYYQDYEKTTKDGNDLYQPKGNPEWKIRFAPSEAGEYSYRIRVTNHGQERITSPEIFLCKTGSMNHGFVRVSENNPLYFVYDDGEPFFAIANCKWWDKMSEREEREGINELGNMEALYTEFARAGGNMTRNFFSRIGEIVESPVRHPDRGFGKIDLERSWRHDESFELSEKIGIHHQVAISSGSYYLPGRRTSMKEQLVYNTLQGGPFEEITAKEYLTHPLAKENFKHILRYFIARWGYSTAIFSWDLFNEIDLTPEYKKLRIEAIHWHREMAQYLDEIDWAGHIVHTNFKTINGSSALDSLPEMEIVSVNKYTSLDFAPLVEHWIKRHIANYKKPAMLSEFGVQPMASEGYLVHDPKCIMLHNGMWSSLMSGSAGTGMPFGRGWLQVEDYFKYINAIARFTSDIPFNKREWRPVTFESFRFTGSTNKIYYADKFLEGCSTSYHFPEGWKNRGSFIVGKEGNVEDIDYMSAFLGPPLGKKENTLQLNYPTDGSFTVFVPTIYKHRNYPGFPVLTVSLDGRTVVNEILTEDTTTYRQNPYKKFTVPVTAGSHTIRLANTGGGFFLTGYEFGNYLQKDGPDIRVRGMKTDDIILLWLKSPKFTWLYSRMGIEPEAQPSGRLVLAGVPDGVWIAEWLDTIENRWIRRAVEQSNSGKLALETPSIQKSVAARLLRSTISESGD